MIQKKKCNTKISTNTQIIYINGRSIMANLEKIESICDKLKPMIVFRSGARVTNEIKDEMNINGYNTIICFSKNRNTGGVVIYIQKQIKYKLIYSNAVEETLWCLAIEAFGCNAQGIYSCFYRANNAKASIFDEVFNEFLTKTVKENKLIINKKNNRTKLFNDTCDRYGLTNTANFHTRITNTSQTKVDVVLSNKMDRTSCEPLNEEKITEHETLLINLKNEQKKDFEAKQTTIDRKFEEGKLA